ncbi:MAF protein [Thiomicrospira sp. ALE5]|nr:MAF protein [Thiomicrospira sp. ALE5]
MPNTLTNEILFTMNHTLDQSEPHFILASQSPYRKLLLKKLIANFDCHSPNIDETRQPGESVADLVARLSQQKAQAIATHFPNSWIIASDQSAALGTDILGKPHEHGQALEQLKKQQGQTLIYHTGVCLYNPEQQTYHYAHEPTEVIFRSLPTETLNNYLLQEQPYDCAGSFKSEGLGIMLFSAIHSQDPNALIGLPLIKLCDLLNSAGLQLPLNGRA